MRFVSIFIVLLFLCTLSLTADPVIKLYVTYGQTPTAVEKYLTAEDMRGALLAVEKINREGGILGRRLAIIDGKASSLEEVKTKALEQIEKDDVIAVVGANTSGMTMIIAPMFQKAGIPVVSPIATHPNVTAIGSYVFRACFTDPFQGTIMAGFALNELSAQTAVILKKAVSNYSVSLSEAFKAAFNTQGVVLWEGNYTAEDSDFTQLLQRVKESKPDVVFVPGHGNDSGLIIKQAHTMGIECPFLGGDGWGKGTLHIAGAEASEGNYFVNHWHADIPTSINQDFVRRYRAKYGKGLIAASAALAYDAVHMVASAVERTDSFDRKQIRDALAETQDFHGVTGIISLNAQGDPEGKQGVIMVYNQGDIQFVKALKP